MLGWMLSREVAGDLTGNQKKQEVEGRRAKALEKHDIHTGKKGVPSRCSPADQLQSPNQAPRPSSRAQPDLGRWGGTLESSHQPAMV